MIELEIDTNACKGSSNEINYIEHVQAFISKFQTNFRVNVHGSTERSIQSLTVRLLRQTLRRTPDPYVICRMKRHEADQT